MFSRSFSPPAAPIVAEMWQRGRKEWRIRNDHNGFYFFEVTTLFCTLRRRPPDRYLHTETGL